MPKPLGPRALFVARTAPRPLSPEQRPRDLPSPQKLKAVSKKRLVINIMLKYVKYGLSMLYHEKKFQDMDTQTVGYCFDRSALTMLTKLGHRKMSQHVAAMLDQMTL